MAAHTPEIAVEYPVGHRRRRQEGIPLLLQKFHKNLLTRFPKAKADGLFALCQDQAWLEKTPVHEFMGEWVAF